MIQGLQNTKIAIVEKSAPLEILFLKSFNFFKVSSMAKSAASGVLEYVRLDILRVQ